MARSKPSSSSPHTRGSSLADEHEVGAVDLLPAHAGVIPAEALVLRRYNHLDAALADILAFTECPQDVWTQIRYNKRAEQPNREIRRRTDAVGIFPPVSHRLPRRSLAGGRTDDEWADGPRHLGLEVLARCRINLVLDINTEFGADRLPALTA